MRKSRRCGRSTAITLCVLVFLISSSLLVISGCGGGVTITGEEIVVNASATLGENHTIHLVQSYVSDARNPARILWTQEKEIWIVLPNMFFERVEDTIPENPESERITICRGGDSVTYSYFNGVITASDVGLNLIPFPGVGANNVYGNYLSPLPNFLDGEDYRIVAEEMVAGRETVKVEIISDREGPEIIGGMVVNERRSHFIYIDKETALILRDETYYGDTLSGAMDTTLVEIGCDIDESLFEFEIPSPSSADYGVVTIHEGAYELSSIEQVEEEAGFALSLPTYLPEGFGLTEVGWEHVPMAMWENPVYLTYSDGRNFFYICEDVLRQQEKEGPFPWQTLEYDETDEVSIDGYTVYHCPVGDINGTFFFEAGDLKVKLTGNVTLEKLKKVAASMMDG
jgi:outer membrane lipoprotein-sorting protein